MLHQSGHEGGREQRREKIPPEGRKADRKSSSPNCAAHLLSNILARNKCKSTHSFFPQKKISFKSKSSPGRHIEMRSHSVVPFRNQPSTPPIIPHTTRSCCCRVQHPTIPPSSPPAPESSDALVEGENQLVLFFFTQFSEPIGASTQIRHTATMYRREQMRQSDRCAPEQKKIQSTKFIEFRRFEFSAERGRLSDEATRSAQQVDR